MSQWKLFWIRNSRRFRRRFSKFRTAGRLRRYAYLFVITFAVILSFNLILRLVLPAFSIDPNIIWDTFVGGVRLVLAEAAPELQSLTCLEPDSCLVILKKGIPFLDDEKGEEESWGEGSWQKFLKNFLSLLTGVEFSQPRAVITTEIPYIVSARETTVVISRNRLSRGDPTPPHISLGLSNERSQESEIEKIILKREPETKGTKWGTQPLVAIYHTHTSESYESISGITHTQGPPGDIVKVGEELARSLTNKYGIPVIHNVTINDYPRWSQAYVNSLASISEVVRRNPSLQVVLDLHRDGFELDNMSKGVAKELVTAVVGGKKVAKVLIIVTTDEFGLPHPNWQKNYNFACLLNDTMHQLYPGLSRGIKIRNDARFNQHVHEHALLLEIGSYESASEEVMLTARMLGDALAVALEKMR